jgi:hypothetical protein
MCTESWKMFPWPVLGCGGHKFQVELLQLRNVGGAKPDTFAAEQGRGLDLVRVVV